MTVLTDFKSKANNIKSLLSSNTAFANPYQPILDQLNVAIADAQGILSVEPSGTTLGQNASAILGALTSLQTQVAQFTSHTNNLSGVNMTNGLNGVNMATIMNVLKTVDEYSNDGGTCQFINSIFGSIVAFASIANSIRILINQLVGIYDAPNVLTNAINTVTALLQGQIQQDLLAFANAQAEAAQYAIANALTQLTGNKCLAKIISIVGTESVKNILITPTIAKTIEGL